MRLIARQLEEDDIYSMQILHRNPDVMKYIHTPEKTLEETRATFTRVMTYPENHPEYGLWSVFLKDRSYTGWIILNHLDGTEDVEIGYRFLPDFWGMGYATEIATEIRNYAFQELDLPAIVGITLPENIASQRVLEKTGSPTGNRHIATVWMCLFFRWATGGEINPEPDLRYSQTAENF